MRKCRCEYVYQLVRTAQGAGSVLLWLDNEGAAERANEEAGKKLKKALEKGIDAVPCMDCGWYQADMVQLLQKRKWQWVQTLGRFFAFVVGIFGGLIVFFGFLGGGIKSPKFLVTPPTIYIILAPILMIAIPRLVGVLSNPNENADSRRGKPVGGRHARKSNFL